MTCNITNTLLRFKIDNGNNDTNKIASTEDTSKKDLTVKIIEEIIQKGENQRFINKIASAVVPKIGEVAELKSYLKL